jgi:sulfite reductase (ferredoxin)
MSQPVGRVGFASVKDIEYFVAQLEKYERGEMDADAWRSFRLTNGVYGQKQMGVQMLRVKVPQGVLESYKLRKLAEVATRYGGRAHVTTRQCIQFYHLPLPEVEGVLRELAAVDFTTKEACGHAVRNVVAAPLAGVDPDELFDVVPYAEALTKHFLRGPLSSSLPRKFKIAFEGSPRDEARAAINDLAFTAVATASGQRAFRVTVGGGTSTLARAGLTLVEELPAGEILGVADAVIRVYHRDGERNNKAKARIKWLIKKIGFDELRTRVLTAWAEIKAAGAPPLGFDPEHPPELVVPEVEPAPAPAGIDELAFATWRRTNVIRQKQAGRVAAQVTLRLGDLSPARLVGLAALVERFSDGTLRTTVDQNVVIRHVPEGCLPALYAELGKLGLDAPGAGSLADVVSCAGADTCAIAVTASRGMGALLTDALAGTSAQTGDDPGLEGATIKVSGCPNGCGQHHIASIGLQGAMRKIGGRAAPLYQIAVGGGPGRFARLVGKFPARRAPQVVERIVGQWKQTREPGERLDVWLARVPLDQIKTAIGELFDIDETNAQEEDFVDLGQTGPFVVGEGEAECAL